MNNDGVMPATVRAALSTHRRRHAPGKHAPPPSSGAGEASPSPSERSLGRRHPRTCCTTSARCTRRLSRWCAALRCRRSAIRNENDVFCAAKIGAVAMTAPRRGAGAADVRGERRRRGARPCSSAPPRGRRRRAARAPTRCSTTTLRPRPEPASSSARVGDAGAAAGVARAWRARCRTPSLAAIDVYRRDLAAVTLPVLPPAPTRRHVRPACENFCEPSIFHACCTMRRRPRNVAEFDRFASAATARTAPPPLGRLAGQLGALLAARRDDATQRGSAQGATELGTCCRGTAR